MRSAMLVLLIASNALASPRRRELTFTLSPTEQSITLRPDMGMEHDTCSLMSMRLIATLRNATSAPIVVAATPYAVAARSAKHGEKTLSPHRIQIDYDHVPHPERDLQRIAPSETATFEISQICSAESTPGESAYEFEGPGDYRFTLAYHYKGPDSGGMPSAYRGTVTSNEVTFHLK